MAQTPTFPTKSVVEKARGTQTARVSNWQAPLAALLRRAGLLGACLALLAALFFAFEKIVADPIIAALICALLAVTAAPMLVTRPAGRERR